MRLSEQIESLWIILTIGLACLRDRTWSTSLKLQRQGTYHDLKIHHKIFTPPKEEVCNPDLITVVNTTSLQLEYLNLWTPGDLQQGTNLTVLDPSVRDCPVNADSEMFIPL